MTYDLPYSHVPPTSPETLAISELTGKITTTGKRGEDGKELTRPHIPNIPNPPYATAKHAHLSTFSLALGPPIMSHQLLYCTKFPRYVQHFRVPHYTTRPVELADTYKSVESSRVAPIHVFGFFRSVAGRYCTYKKSLRNPNRTSQSIRQLVCLSVDTASGAH